MATDLIRQSKILPGDRILGFRYILISLFQNQVVAQLRVVGMSEEMRDIDVIKIFKLFRKSRNICLKTRKKK